MKLLTILLMLLATPALAGEHAGVTMADTASVGSQSLKLQGMGLRKALGIAKVYVAGLYTPSGSGGADAVLAMDGPRRVTMHMLMGLDSEKVGSSIEDGFKRNSGSQMGALNERLTKFKAMFPNSKKGDVITLDWVPGKGTVSSVNGKELGVIEGEDFGRALFAVWLGTDPVAENLKAGMLGQ
jgi:hypothetical protein